MAAAGAIVHRGLAWLFLSLAFAGWAILLGGLASLQQACYGSFEQLAELMPPEGRRRLLQNPLVGTVGYLAPVGCAKIFSYTWWIMVFDLVVLVVLAVGATTFIGRFRGAMVAISASLLLLLMDTANTYLYFNSINGLSGAVATRARVIVAGAIISSVAYFILIAIIGWHNEDVSVTEAYDAEAAGKKKRPLPGEKKKGLLGGLLGGRHRTEEEAGAGVAGSPRFVEVPHAPVVPQLPPGATPRPAGAPAGGATTTIHTTTYTATVPVAVVGGSPAGAPRTASAGTY